MIKFRNIEELKKSYPIQRWVNNPILRRKSEEVKKIDDNIRSFAKVLKILMYEYDWVWLAAPQIWNNIRIIAVTFWEKKRNKYNFLRDEIMINPKITYFSKKTNIDEEGCLSLPGITWDVERFNEIEVEYLDINWKKNKVRLKDLNARIVQHEIDHLDGILFVDKLVKKNKFKNLVKSFINKSWF